MGFIRDLLFGPREPRVDDFRVRPRRNKPIYCMRCGKYINDVYLYDGFYYGQRCCEALMAEAELEELRREVERRLERRPNPLAALLEAVDDDRVLRKSHASGQHGEGGTKRRRQARRS